MHEHTPDTGVNIVPRITDRFLSLDAVCRMTNRSRSSIYRDVDNGEFPAPYRVGPKSNGWRLSEIQQWMDERPRRKAINGS